MLLLSGGRQNEISQRKEGEQCHIVGDKHGADKGDVHQCQNGKTGSLEALDDLSRQHIEESDVLQCTDHCQNTEQTGQGLEIKIIQIRTVWGNEETGDDGRQQGNGHGDIISEKGKSLVDHVFILLSTQNRDILLQKE